MTPSNRTIKSLYQAARLTNVIRITAEQFSHSNELKDLQMYEFHGMEFFRACNLLWELNEETGMFDEVTPLKIRDRVYVGVVVPKTEAVA